MAGDKAGTKLIAPNKKARHDYFVIDTYEAGVELFGTEVKSLRRGQVNLKDSYCYIDKGELFAAGIQATPARQSFPDPAEDCGKLMHQPEEGCCRSPLSRSRQVCRRNRSRGSQSPVLQTGRPSEDGHGFRRTF